MARMKLAKAASYLAYSQRKLETVTDEADIAFWREKVAFYKRVLEGRCQRCGRELRDPESRRRGFGSECATKVDAALLEVAS